MKILVAGGAGYIGTHTCVELIQAAHEVVIADNLCNSKIEAVYRTEKIVQREISFYFKVIGERIKRFCFGKSRVFYCVAAIF